MNKTKEALAARFIANPAGSSSTAAFESEALNEMPWKCAA